MRNFRRLSKETVDGLMDRACYQVVWQCRVKGDVIMDGDTHFLGMTRARAIEACQSLEVLKVYCLNFSEGTVRDVTLEVMEEALPEEEAA